MLLKVLVLTEYGTRYLCSETLRVGNHVSDPVIELLIFLSHTYSVPPAYDIECFFEYYYVLCFSYLG